MTLPIPFTDQQIADKLTIEGDHWKKTTITYSFNNLSTTGNDLDAIHMAWIKSVLDEMGDLLNLTFVETAGLGDLTFSGHFDNDLIWGEGTYTVTYPQSFGDQGELFAADVYFDLNWASNQSSNLSFGSYGLATIVHEILHGLGVQHPGDYNAGEGELISYLNDAEFLQDTKRYTIMSYFEAEEDNSGAVHFDHVNGVFVYPQTLMIYDFLALTDGSFNGYFGGYSIPGYNTGNTTYGYNATAGILEQYNFDVNGAPVLTIIDSGGIDTLDLSGDTTSSQIVVNYVGDAVDWGNYAFVTRTEALIDLREGMYSSTHGMTFNIGIAFGAIIENAIGTQFDDKIYGNDSSNEIFGGNGNDTVYGGVGADLIRGGIGNDILGGGWWNDQLYGDEGNDSLFGEGGNDQLYGGVGVDLLRGGAGNDTLFGGWWNDQLFGDEGNDNLYGDGGNDQLYGGVGADLLRGGEGNDTLFGGWWNDVLYGDDGNDTLFGDGGDDLLYGGVGADFLHGGDGNDTIVGGWWDDQLFGGWGNDVLTGSGGADTFNFETDFGDDQVTDWENGVDALDLTSLAALGIHGFGDLVVDTYATYSRIMVESDTITFSGFTATFDSSNWLFA